MNIGADITKRERFGVYLCILPLIARFVLSHLFARVCLCVQNFTVSYLLSLALSALAWILPFGLFAAFFTRKESERATCKYKFDPWIIFFGAYFVAGIITIAYNVILAKLGYAFPSDEIACLGMVEIIGFVLSSVVLVPIAEEFAFRKVILFNLLPTGKIAAVLISSVLFALCHDPASYIYSFVMGIALAIICLQRSFIYAVIIHAANNAISCAFTLMQRFLTENAYRIISVIRFAVVCVVGIVCVAVIVKGRCSCAKK